MGPLRPEAEGGAWLAAGQGRRGSLTEAPGEEGGRLFLPDPSTSPRARNAVSAETQRRPPAAASDSRGTRPLGRGEGGRAGRKEPADLSDGWSVLGGTKAPYGRLRLPQPRERLLPIDDKATLRQA